MEYRDIACKHCGVPVSRASMVRTATCFECRQRISAERSKAKREALKLIPQAVKAKEKRKSLYYWWKKSQEDMGSK